MFTSLQCFVVNMTLNAVNAMQYYSFLQMENCIVSWDAALLINAVSSTGMARVLNS